MFLQAHAQSYRLDHKRGKKKQQNQHHNIHTQQQLRIVFFVQGLFEKFQSKCTPYPRKWDSEEPKAYDMNWMPAMCVFYAHLLLARNYQRRLRNFGCFLRWCIYRGTLFSPEAQSPAWRNSVLKFKSPLTAIDHVLVYKFTRAEEKKRWYEQNTQKNNVKKTHRKQKWKQIGGHNWFEAPKINRKPHRCRCR